MRIGSVSEIRRSQMNTAAIQFANTMGSRNEAVIVYDLGDKFEVSVRVKPTVNS